eukprot:c16375_g2_i1 orf=496-1056(-)
MAMVSPTSLVYYSAVAKGAVVLAEYIAQGNIDLPAIATDCLENVPPFHSRFSYTTRQRRFICIVDGIFTYCAIMDEALSNADAYTFLQSIRDAFKTLHKGRGPDSEALTLGAHLLDEDIVPIMKQHAVMLVGVPQRERNRLEMEVQAERDAEVDPEVSSPSAVDEEFQGYCCWQVGSWLKCLCDTK